MTIVLVRNVLRPVVDGVAALVFVAGIVSILSGFMSH